MYLECRVTHYVHYKCKNHLVNAAYTEGAGIVLTVTPRCRKERSSGTHKTIIPADGKGLWLVGCI